MVVVHILGNDSTPYDQKSVRKRDHVLEYVCLRQVCVNVSEPYVSILRDVITLPHCTHVKLPYSTTNYCTFVINCGTFLINCRIIVVICIKFTVFIIVVILYIT